MRPREMSRGEYHIYRPTTKKLGNTPDTSWKSMTCALLIFGAICFIIFLATWPWKFGKHDHHNDEFHNDDRGEHAEYVDSTRPKHGAKFEKIVDSTIDSEKIEKDNIKNALLVYKIYCNDICNKCDQIENLPRCDLCNCEIDLRHNRDTTVSSNNVEIEAGLMANTKGDTNTGAKHNTTLNKNSTTQNENTTILPEHTTTKNENTTTLPEHKTSKNESTTTLPEHKTLKNENTIIFPEHKTTQNENTTTLPEHKTTQNKNIPTRPEHKTSQNENTTTLPEHKTSKNENTTTLPEHKTLKNENTITFPEHKTTQNENTTTLPEHKTTQNKNIPTRPEHKTSHDENTTTLPEHKTTNNENTTTLPEHKTTQTEIITTLIESEHGLKDIKDKDCNEKCTSADCNRITRELNGVSHANKLCNDLYTFACFDVNSTNRVEVLHDVVKDRANQSSLHGTEEFQQYYSSCTSYDPGVNCLSHIRNTLYVAGEFTSKVSQTNAKSLTELLSILLLKDFPVFFDLQIEIDGKSGKNIFVIYPVILEDMVLIKENELCKNNYTEKRYFNMNLLFTNYEDLPSTITKNLGEILKQVDVFYEVDREESINKIKKTTLGLLQALKASPLYPQYNRKKCSNPEYVTISGMKTILKPIKWDLVVKQLLATRKINENDTIIVHHLDYLKHVFNTLSSMNKSDLHDAILALYVHKLFSQFLQNESNLCDKKKHCAMQSLDLMADVHTALYLDSFDDWKTHRVYTEAKGIFENLMQKQASLLHANAPENVTKSLKLYTLEGCDIDLDTILKKRYTKIKIEDDKQTNKYVENTVKLNERKRKLMYSSYQMDPQSAEYIWFFVVSPYEQNIKLIVELDKIIVPLGALYKDGPFYETPYYVYMADVGFQLAREISRFSNSKVSTSNAISWNETAHLTIDTPIYNENTTIAIYPDDSRRDREADSSGAELALLTMKSMEEEKPCPTRITSKYYNSHTEIFFLHLVQNLCTEESVYNFYRSFDHTQIHPLVRVNSMIENTASFSQTFQCPPNTKMMGGIKL